MSYGNIKPYEGKKDYIFISYSHRDKEQVYPIIEQLQRDGYRVWYDEGIHPGSEWPEIIAEHLNDSAICFAFVTQNYLDSSNCKREVHFALMKEKPLISIVLEKVDLPLGMEMQLSVTQAINKFEISSDDKFFRKIYEVKAIESCKCGEDEDDVTVILDKNAYDKSPILLDFVHYKAFVLTKDEIIIGREGRESDIACKGIEDKTTVKLIISGRRYSLKPEDGNIEINGETVEENSKIDISDREVFYIKDSCFRIVPPQESEWIKSIGKVIFLRNCDTDERDAILSQNYLMGRSYQWENGTFSDERVSRKHAMIFWLEGKPYVMDLGSKNKTFIDGSPVIEGKNERLTNKCILRLGKHTRIECTISVVLQK